MRTLATATATVAATGFGVATWAFAEANALFTLREATVPVLAPGQAPMRVLHLSDLHLLPVQLPKRRWVARLQALEPDLVVNTGDNISSPRSLEPLYEMLGSLLDTPGAFVFGSNDYTAPIAKNPLNYLGIGRKRTSRGDELPWREMRDEFTRRGWVDLNNAAATVRVAGVPVHLRGTDDAHLDRDRYADVAGPVDPFALTIGVTHAPYLRVLDQFARDGVPLVLAGHTHGGQVCLPVKGAIVTNCDIDGPRARGLSRHAVDGATSWLHVSGGLGTSPYAPYRLFCRPEATLLTLVPTDGPAPHDVA